MRNKVRSHADPTRSALLEAGLQLFGERGYDATSIRQIATLAQTNIAAVNYHFGGKAGLRLACAELIVEAFSEVTQGLLDIDQVRSDSSPQEAETLLVSFYAKLARFLIGQKQKQDFVPFIMRELIHPSDALEHIYLGIYGPAHANLCLLWQRATGDEAEAEQTKLRLFSLLGQMVYFRLARPIVTQRMDWAEIGEAELDSIVGVLTQNFKLVLAAAKQRLEVNHD